MISFLNKSGILGIDSNRSIFLVGPMGAGKSTVGRKLAQRLDMEFFDSDREIEIRTGVNISWVFDVEGELGFRNREEKVIDELTRKNGIVLATGGGSIKSFLTRCCLSSRGVVVYLETTVEGQLFRTQRDKRRPLLRSSSVISSGGNVRTLLENLAYERNPLYEEIANVRISTDGRSVKVIVSEIVALYNRLN